MTVTYDGVTYTCDVALKGATYVHLVDSTGALVACFDGVSDFSLFTIADGSWTTPASADNCNVATVGEDGMLHKSDTKLCDLYGKNNKPSPADIGAAATSHGNHVPATETASNKKFLRNDNTWQTVTPANIGAAASSHTHTKSQITDFPTSMTPTAHNQAASTITTGTFNSTATYAKTGTDYTTYRIRNIAYNTSEMTASSTSLTNGNMYFQYE